MTTVRLSAGFFVALFTLSPAQTISQAAISPSVQGGHASQSQLGAFLDELGGLQTEYKADLGLDVLEENWKVIPLKKKLGALHNIFDTAPAARYESRLRYASNRPDSNASQISSTMTSIQLDRLSIQTRVVRLALRDMPKLASDLFDRISLPSTRSTCLDPLVADLTSYYDTLALLMQDAHVQTIGGQPKSDFLIEVARATKTPEELAPFILMLSKLKIQDNARASLVIYLAQNVERADASDREMKSLENELDLGMHHLILNLREMNGDDVKLLVAYRHFLTGNLSKEYCTDAPFDRTHIASSFNDLIPPDASRSVSILELQELKPRGAGATSVDPPIPFDSSLKPIFQRIGAASQARKLEMYQTGVLSSSIEPETADVQDALRYVFSLAGNQEGCPLCQFHARAQVLLFLQNTIPPGPSLEMLIASEVDFLSHNEIETHDPPAFLTLLKSLVIAARPVSAEARQDLSKEAKGGKKLFAVPSEAADSIEMSLRHSNDPIIRAYVDYEATFQPAYPSIPHPQR